MLKSRIIITLLVITFLGFGNGTLAHALTVKQGEVLIYPITAKITQENLTATFGGVKIPVFEYKKQYYALVAADVGKKLGNYNLRIKSGNKEIEKKSIQVKAGTYPKKVTGVAYKFGTLSKDKQASVSADKNLLVAALAKATPADATKLWGVNFRNPLEKITITGPYGSRRVYTNHTTIHKGVDFRAKVGTPVYAVSNGEVLWGKGKALYQEGPMVAIDHGGGIVSKYLHLSEVLVNAGDMVREGDLIGYSGDKGADVQGAHLHFSINVGKASVNPTQFLSEFQKLN